MATRDIAGVELLRVGVWDASSEFVVTRRVLQDLVDSHSRLVGRFAAPVKLGHNDAQRLAGEDGLPSLGRVVNLRVQGDSLIGDLRGVPEVLARVLDEGAFPERSVEVISQMQIDGETFAHVLVGLALLGEVPPAVSGLAPLPLSTSSISDIEALFAAALESGSGQRIVMSHRIYAAMVPLHSPPVIDLEWDRLAALQRVTRWASAVADDPSTLDLDQFAHGFASIQGPMDEVASFRFLHHDILDGQLVTVPEAVRSAIEAAREAGDQDAIAHLENHLIDLDSPPVADPNSELNPIGDEDMELSAAIREALGMSADSTDADVVARAEALRQRARRGLAAKVTAALEAGDDDDIVELATRLRAEAEEAERIQAANARLSERVAALETEHTRLSAAAVVDRAVDDGRITAASRDQWIRSATNDLESTRKLLETLTPRVEFGRVGADTATAGDSDISTYDATPDERFVAEQMGVWSAQHRASIIRGKAKAAQVDIPEDDVRRFVGLASKEND